MKANIFVQTGEVWATGRRVILRADGIGSCCVIAAYDTKKKIGALAHVMLPGQSTEGQFLHNTKYARDAIENLLFKMTRLGTVKDNISACLVGGGNVLQDKDDTICKAVINSVIELLTKNGIKIVAKILGGIKRRSVFIDIERGEVFYTEGDGGEKLLYKCGGRRVLI
ncbi:MAG: chemotaxis protein CheD [Candidatus Scalinduaceae bacterium]